MVLSHHLQSFRSIYLQGSGVLKRISSEAYKWEVGLLVCLSEFRRR